MIPLLFTILSFSPVAVHHTAPVATQTPAPMVGAAAAPVVVPPAVVEPTPPKAPAPAPSPTPTPAPVAVATTTTLPPAAVPTTATGVECVVTVGGMSYSPGPPDDSGCSGYDLPPGASIAPEPYTVTSEQ